MISTSAAGAGDLVVAVEAAGLIPAPQFDVVAVRDAAGTEVALRVVHLSFSPTTANISVPGCALTNASARVLTLTGRTLTEQNTPTAPTAVAPVESSVRVGDVGAAPAFQHTFPPWSFVTLNVRCGVAAVADAATAAAPTTCDELPPATPPSFTWSSHTWSFYNAGPWATSAQAAPADGAASLSMAGNTLSAFDMAVATDVALPPSGGWVATSLRLAPNMSASAVDAGLVVRCVLGGIGPGKDSFDCYEASLSANTGGPGSGYVLVGAHWLPGNYQQLARVAWDVPAGVNHGLNVSVACRGGTACVIGVRVNGTLAVNVTDAVHASTINGGYVGVRAFYTDATWVGLETGGGG